MDMISDTPAWFLALSEMSEVLCRDSSDVETLVLSMLCSGKISRGWCGALSTTDVIYSLFLKATTSWKLVF